MSSCKLTETHLSPTLALIMLLTLSMIMLTLSKAYTCTYAQHCLGMYMTPERMMAKPDATLRLCMIAEYTSQDRLVQAKGKVETRQVFCMPWAKQH